MWNPIFASRGKNCINYFFYYFLSSISLELLTPTGQTGFKAEIDGKKILRPDFEKVGDFLSYTLHPEKDLALIKFKPNKNLRSNYHLEEELTWKYVGFEEVIVAKVRVTFNF